MNEEVKTRGRWSFYSLAPDIQADSPEVKQLRDIERGIVSQSLAEKFMQRLIEQGIVLRMHQQNNLVPTVGRAVLARRLAGNVTYTGAVTYIALGSGTTAFTNASVQLNTEVFRKVTSDASYDTNIAYVDCFIASGDVANATYKEAGAFIDGAVGTNTGQLFSAVVQDFVKSGSMYISLKVTFS